MSAADGAVVVTDLVTVCSACLCASCWHGEHLCDSSRGAGTVAMPVQQLRELGREHPSNWGAAKMAEVYGHGSGPHLRAVCRELEQP